MDEPDPLGVIAKPIELISLSQPIEEAFQIVKRNFGLSGANDVSFDISSVDSRAETMHDAVPVAASMLLRLQALHYCAKPDTSVAVDVLVGLVAVLTRDVQGLGQLIYEADEVGAIQLRHVLEGLRHALGVITSELGPDSFGRVILGEVPQPPT